MAASGGVIAKTAQGPRAYLSAAVVLADPAEKTEEHSNRKKGG